MPSASQFHHLLVIKYESLFLHDCPEFNGMTLPNKLVNVSRECPENTHSLQHREAFVVLFPSRKCQDFLGVVVACSDLECII